MTIGNTGLQFFNRFIFKLRNRTAAGTDEMVVMLAFGDMFISGLSVSETHLMGNPRLGKKLQSPAHRGITDARVPGPQFPVQFLHTHVPLRGKEKIKDDIPLSRGFQALPDNELPEDFFFLLAFQTFPPN
jgi:hypothetical protein